MHATFVDIENEFSDIAEEVEHLSRFLDRLTESNPIAERQASWEATHVCASATEKIYTGCELIMAQVAREVDDAPIAHSDGWQKDGASVPQRAEGCDFRRVLPSDGSVARVPSS
jgi:hypothetical protein